MVMLTTENYHIAKRFLKFFAIINFVIGHGIESRLVHRNNRGRGRCGRHGGPVLQQLAEEDPKD